jgi:uncharacterized protein YwqG
MDVKREKVLKIGQSKFGGNPDLPKKMPNNIKLNKTFQFVAQMNLSDIDLNNTITYQRYGLPNKGMLYFFVQPDDCDEAQVFYYDSNDPNDLITYKIDKELTLKQCSIKYFEAMSHFVIDNPSDPDQIIDFINPESFPYEGKVKTF